MEELLTKYFTGEITRQEKELLFEAMNTDEALRKEFYALQNTIALTGCLEEEADRDYGSQSYSQFKRDYSATVCYANYCIAANMLP